MTPLTFWGIFGLTLFVEIILGVYGFARTAR